MPESYYQYPVDTSALGKMGRTRTRPQGANTVHEPYVALGGEATWSIYQSIPTAVAAKVMFACYNSGAQTLRIKKVFIQNIQTATVTGGLVTFEFLRITNTPSGGTTITPVIHDTTDTALSSFTCVHTPTGIAAGSIFFSLQTGTEENTTTDVANRNTQLALMNALPEDEEMYEIRLAQNEGFAIRQTSAAVVSSFGFYIVISKAW